MPPKPPHGDHHHPPHLRPHPASWHHDYAELHVLRALELLIEKRVIATVADLASAAEALDDGGIAASIRAFDGKETPLELILEGIRTKIELSAFDRQNDLVKRFRELPIALIFPLPPHIVDEFRFARGAAVLLPDGQDSPRVNY